MLEGEYEPFDAPVPTTVGAVVEGLSHVYEAPGRVRFNFNGAEHTLTAFNGRNGGLSILFTDETSGVTTYAANRQLAATPHDGKVVLDFNRAYEPAVRVHRLRHLPAAARGQPPVVRRGGGGEDAVRARLAGRASSLMFVLPARSRSHGGAFVGLRS